MIQNFYHRHKYFLVQVGVLCVLILLVMLVGSRKQNTYKPPVTKTDLLISRLQEENKRMLADTMLLQAFPKLTFDLPEVVIRYKSSIMIGSAASTTKTELIGFILSNNPTLEKQYVRRVVDAYIADCALEGINHDIAISQMCLETGFLRFKGAVKMNQFNFCGLGAIGKETAGLTFASLEEGVRAHVQHLKAYSSHEPLSTKLVDTRFAFVKRGIAPDIQALSGTWASDLNYGYKMEAMMRILLKKTSTSEILAKGV